MTENKQKIRIIKIAILAEEPLGWGSGKHYFPVILNNYKWQTKQKEYQFKTEYVYDKDILKGRLKDFDVLLCPGGGVGDGEAIMKGFRFLPKARKWKKQIKKYIENGGSYVGICGGVACFTGLDKGDGRKPKTLFERLYNNSNVGASCVKHFYKDLALPLFYPFQRKHPEKIGATGYIFSFKPSVTKNNKRVHTGGVPVDFVISKDNPVFSDYKDDKIRIRWWGGPGLTVPEKPDRAIKVLAKYPKDDFSTNPKTKINAWYYNGGITGLIRAFFKSLSILKKAEEKLKDVFIYTYYLAKPWVNSDKIVDLNYSDKPSITAEIYPNENKGRIILCTSHPEYMIWWNGYIEETKQNSENCIAEGFHEWKDISNFSKDYVDELTYTWWIVRRITAWAAKIPDDHLPPIKKDELNKDVEKIIKENILSDGTLLNQMKNI